MGDYLIGAHARIEDAALLVEAGRYEGELLMLLVALSATSRKVYPESEVKSPGEAFERFVEDRRQYFSGLEDALQQAGRDDLLGEFLWKTLRNALEHEGQLDAKHHPVGPPDIVVTLSGDASEGIGLSKLALCSLEKAVSRCIANSSNAVKPDVQNRHPEQPDEAYTETVDLAKWPEQRLERIEFFLKWFRLDQRAIDALESEKLKIKNLFSRLSDGSA